MGAGKAVEREREVTAAAQRDGTGQVVLPRRGACMWLEAARS